MKYGKLNTWLLCASSMCLSLSAAATKLETYYPDYSYAGYQNSEAEPNTAHWKVINVDDEGLTANDGLDDTQALKKLIASLASSDEPVILQFNAGRYILSDIIFIKRSQLLIRGVGTASDNALATEFYFPRPLMYAPQPQEFDELAEYLVKFNKVQKEKKHNIKLPYSLYSWSGGFFWTAAPGDRSKAYLAEYDKQPTPLALIEETNAGVKTFKVDQVEQLKVGQVVQINWYNKSGKNGSLLNTLYGDKLDNIGSHHWNFPDRALSRQQTEIVNIKGNQVTIKTPLIHPVKAQWQVSLTNWNHIHNVGFEQFKITFPEHPYVAHHVEPGFNGIYLTGLYNGWVKDVQITDADSAILTEKAANITIERVQTKGKSLAHYSVQMGGVHHVLVKDLIVKNPVMHPLSFNTLANNNVYLNSVVEQVPVLDQHSGANHQNLFDNITVYADLEKGQTSYPLFKGGGAGYWKPSHGRYSTFWNISVVFNSRPETTQPIILNGMKDGPDARLIGVHANLPVEISYGPDAIIKHTGEYYQAIPSLFQYQLQQRLKGQSR